MHVPHVYDYTMADCASIVDERRTEFDIVTGIDFESDKNSHIFTITIDEILEAAGVRRANQLNITHISINTSHTTKEFSAHLQIPETNEIDADLVPLPLVQPHTYYSDGRRETLGPATLTNVNNVRRTLPVIPSPEQFTPKLMENSTKQLQPDWIEHSADSVKATVRGYRFKDEDYVFIPVSSPIYKRFFVKNRGKPWVARALSNHHTFPGDHGGEEGVRITKALFDGQIQRITSFLEQSSHFKNGLVVTLFRDHGGVECKEPASKRRFDVIIGFTRIPLSDTGRFVPVAQYVPPTPVTTDVFGTGPKAPPKTVKLITYGDESHKGKTQEEIDSEYTVLSLV